MNKKWRSWFLIGATAGFLAGVGIYVESRLPTKSEPAEEKEIVEKPAPRPKKKLTDIAPAPRDVDLTRATRDEETNEVVEVAAPAPAPATRETGGDVD